MKGAEYIDEECLINIWQQIEEALKTEIYKFEYTKSSRNAKTEHRQINLATQTFLT